MPRETQREKLLERYDPDQQSLFDDDGTPMQAELLQALELRRYEHKGVRLVENDARAAELVSYLMAGWGVKRIAVKMEISPKTVRAARRLLASQGKLAPFEQRLVAAMEDAMEANAEAYRDAAEARMVPVTTIPVGNAVTFDKRQLVVGRPTSINATLHARPPQFSVEEINASFVDISSASESASLPNAQKPLQNEGCGAMDVTLDATHPPIDPPPAPVHPAADGRMDGRTAAPADGPRPGAGGMPTAGAVVRKF